MHVFLSWENWSLVSPLIIQNLRCNNLYLTIKFEDFFVLKMKKYVSKLNTKEY